LIKAKKPTSDVLIVSFLESELLIVVSANCMKKARTTGIAARVLNGRKI
jgi:hypothetical protein